MNAQAANDALAHGDQPALDLALPVAKIRGEPLAEMPSDLVYGAGK